MVSKFEPGQLVKTRTRLPGTGVVIQCRTDLGVKFPNDEYVNVRFDNGQMRSFSKSHAHLWLEEVN